MTSNLGVPSGALALMAWGLACSRRYGDTSALPRDWLAPRYIVNLTPKHKGAQGEYYRIIDRIARGEKP